MRNILNEIKWAYQRVVRGYDDRVMWGFDSYFITILDPLKEFCLNWALHDYAYLNEEKLKVFAETVMLIDEFKRDEEKYMLSDESLSRLLEYVGKNINYYWD